MVKARRPRRSVIPMQVPGRVVFIMGKGLINGMMAESMLDTGMRVRCTARAFYSAKTVTFTLEVYLRTIKMLIYPTCMLITQLCS